MLQQNSAAGVVLTEVRKAQTVRVSVERQHGRHCASQSTAAEFCSLKAVKPKRKSAEWRSPRGERRFEPYGPSVLNLLNRRLRTRMYVGVAGESGRPLSPYADCFCSCRLSEGIEGLYFGHPIGSR